MMQNKLLLANFRFDTDEEEFSGVDILVMNSVLSNIGQVLPTALRDRGEGEGPGSSPHRGANRRRAREADDARTFGARARAGHRRAADGASSARRAARGRTKDTNE